jgi:hypothetical protein
MAAVTWTLLYIPSGIRNFGLILREFQTTWDLDCAASSNGTIPFCYTSYRVTHRFTLQNLCKVVNVIVLKSHSLSSWWAVGAAEICVKMASYMKEEKTILSLSEQFIILASVSRHGKCRLDFTDLSENLTNRGSTLVCMLNLYLYMLINPIATASPKNVSVKQWVAVRGTE